MEKRPSFFCGIDWSATLHDVAVLDKHGAVVARAQITSSPDGVRALFKMLDGLRNSHTHGRRLVPVAIETNRGLLVHALRVKKQPVYHIPPSMVVAERRRRSPAKKSDPGDAELLAAIILEGWSRLRPLPDTSPQATALTVLAQAQLRAQRTRERLQAQLRALLGQAHPAALEAWAGMDHGLRRAEARAVLAAGPTAATARRLTPHRLERILTDAGRFRLTESEAYRLHDLFQRTEVLRLPTPVEKALAADVRMVLGMLDHACTVNEQLTDQMIEVFAGHPHAPIYRSFPACGDLTGARLLTELGDDPDRFSSARGLRAYAGLAPLTWQSGSSRLVTHRRVCNRRLKSACHQWAFSSLTRSPGCRALYDRRRAAGDGYAAALRRVAGHLLTGLRHCLLKGQEYDEQRAFPG